MIHLGDYVTVYHPNFLKVVGWEVTRNNAEDIGMHGNFIWLEFSNGGIVLNILKLSIVYCAVYFNNGNWVWVSEDYLKIEDLQ